MVKSFRPWSCEHWIKCREVGNSVTTVHKIKRNFKFWTFAPSSPWTGPSGLEGPVESCGGGPPGTGLGRPRPHWGASPETLNIKKTETERYCVKDTLYASPAVTRRGYRSRNKESIASSGQHQLPGRLRPHQRLGRPTSRPPPPSWDLR